VLTLTNSNRFALTTNLMPYRFYRIFGVAAANALAGIASEVYFDFNTSTYQASRFPKANCINDTDGDKVFNHLDLDTDGDGCSDAFEAGTTTATTANFAHPTTAVGTNGLVNSLETIADNGIYNGTYTYDIAVDNTINRCTDSDNDGVVDLLDLDDDNDGVLDTHEQATCVVPAAFTLKNINGTNTGALGYNTTFPSWMRLSFAQLQPGFALSFDTPVEDVALQFASIYEVDRIGDFSVKLSDGTVINKVEFDLLTSYAPTAAIWTPQPNNVNNFTGNFTKNYGAPFSDGTPYFQTLNPTGGTQQSWGIVRLKNIPGATTKGIVEVSFRILESDATSGTAGLAVYTSCVSYLDTDNDGIPNRLDLDSDGDGCADAIESGSSTTVTSTTVYPTGTDTNRNGLLNNYEGTTAGTVNYTSRYSDFAIDPTLNACLDTDGDGIKDVFDIDDDNDGVLDEDEQCISAVNIEADGSFESASAVASNNAFNSDVTAAGWINGVGTLDTWISPMPTLGTGLWGGMADGMPSSPNGGVFAAGWVTNANPNTTNESLYKVINNLVIGQKYTLIFYQANAGVEGITPINSSANWKVLFGNDVVHTPEIPYLGEGNQVWQKIELEFVATSVSQRLEFLVNNGLVGGYYECMALDGISLKIGGKHQICTIDTDNDNIPNHLDLDSDGDGCADAIESRSSTSARSTTVFPTGTDTNTNGLLNNYESTTAGTVNYNSTYEDYALDNSINACKDTDGDFVGDIFDLDDDNDGLLDTEEGNICATLTDDKQIFNDPVIKQFNQVVNGDFEMGNTRFTSTYRFGGLGGCGEYMVQPLGWASSAGSLSEGNAMQINADCEAPFTAFWSQTVTVKPNTNYKLGFSIRHGNPAGVSYSINGGGQQGNFGTTGSWVSRQATINSGNRTTMAISLFETTGAPMSADFAVDDIFLIEILDV
jgi:hypothetical protein